MFLKKLFYSFFIYLFFQSSCIALCFTDKVDFGDSIEEVSSKLKIPALVLPTNKKNVERLTVPADLICYGDFFDNLSLAFIFGENQFAQIVGTLRKNEKNLDLLDWLEREFGSRKKTVKDLNTSAKAVEFTWDKDLLFIFYAMRRNNEETTEYMEIIAKRYVKFLYGGKNN